MAFNVVFVPGKIWQDSDVVNAGSLNEGDGGGAWTVTGSSRDLSDVSADVPTDGEILIYSSVTGKWTPGPLPVSTSDTFNREFAWGYYL